MASLIPRWTSLITAFFAFGGLGLFAAVSESDDGCGSIADNISHGGIVWTENAVFVQGTAAPNLSDPYKPLSAIKRETQRAATLDAYRKIAEVLAGVTVTSDRLVADNPRILVQIQAYVPHLKICNSKFYADGGVDMVVKVPLAGELAKALLPNAGSRVAASKSKFTGLIVDARDLTFSPAFAPRLLATDGRILFSQQNVKRKVITKRGAVQYVDDPAAVDSRFVGKRPLRVRAIGLGSLSPSDLVVDQKSADGLIDLPAFLGDGKVVIITAPVRKLECKNLAEKVKDRLVDWERKIVLARGFGRIDFSGKEDASVRLRKMERAAEVDAQRKLMEALLDLKVRGSLALKQEPTASRHTRGVVKNAIRCDAKYYKDGTSEIVLAAWIDGIAVRGAGLGHQGESSKTFTPSGPTGLIVDATGLNFSPVLAPQLAAPDGTIIYDGDAVARGYAQLQGVVGYRSSHGTAKSDKRIGKLPLTVRAAKAEEDSSRLVLTAQDADRLKDLENLTGLFNQGRVVIITENTVQY
ncbi:MAG: hypothetical protein PVI06_02875 [Desulfobacterales bacterium]